MWGLWLGLALAGTRGVKEVPDRPQEALDDAYRDRVALVVGVDPYADTQIADLHYASQDADALASALIVHGGFEDVLPLNGVPISQEQFWRSFSNIKTGLGPDDTFVLYFAGHGSLGEDGRTLYLLFSDSRLDDLPGTAVALNVLMENLEQLPARKRVLILDTCHNTLGEGRASVPESIRGLGFRGGSFVRAARAAEVRLYAAAQGGVAIEDADLGRDGDGGGVYTHFLVEALEGQGDGDGDGLVTVQEAHKYASAATIHHTDGRQAPLIESSEVAEETIFLAGSVADIDAKEDRRIAELPVSDTTPTGTTRAPEGAGAELPVVSSRDWLVGAGTRRAWDGDEAFVTDWALRAVGWTPLSARWWLGAQFDYGLGAAPVEGVLRAGQGGLNAAFLGGETWAVGPSVGLGVMWQQTDAVRFGTTLSYGGLVRWTGERVFVSLDPTVAAVLSDTRYGVSMIPSAGVSAGARL